MGIRIRKTAFILICVFLTGCGRNVGGMEKREDASVEKEGGNEASIETENAESVAAEVKGRGDIPEEPDVQYPLIAAPSEAKWIDFVFVSEEGYCIFDGEAYGYIAEDGKEIAPCIYDIAYPFNEGLACVCKDGKYGYIDLEGETALPFDYDRATPFMEGLAYFAIGDTYGFMDKTGTPVFHFECDSVSSFQEGLAYFSINGHYGYIDQDGQIAIEPIFDDAGYFKEGLAKVMKDGRYGIINRNGDLIVAAEYDWITIDGSFIIAQSNGEYACFNRTGKLLLEQSGYIYAPTSRKYAYFEREGKRGLIDEKGNILIEPLYDWIWMSEQNFLIVQEDGLYGVLDMQGEVRIPAIYDNIYYDSYVEASTADGIFLLTDADGNVESVDAADFSEKIPCSYDSINWLNRDRAVVSLDGLSGIIDREGNVIEPIVYDIIRGFVDGAVWMKKDGEDWFYNSSGEVVEDIGSYDNISLDGNYYKTEKDGKYGFLNEEGEEVVPPVYDYISDYQVCGSSSNIYILTDYSSDVHDSLIKTGEPAWDDISRMLLQNEITPRIGLYQDFMQNGSISVEDATPSGHTANQEMLRGYKKTYKLYDLNYSKEPILYFEAEPYMRNNFPLSYSGFYTICDNQLVELFTGYECGGSLRGDYVCLWYDRETSRVLPGTNGMWGGFGGYFYRGTVYDGKGGEMINIASFEYRTQSISDYSDEELVHAELLYDRENKPYTKETIAQAIQERDSAQEYSVNGAQVTIEEYQEMENRYQILFCVE